MHKLTHKERGNISTKTKKLIKKGIVKKLNYCEKCKSDLLIECHHNNYEDEADVTWLCRNCHKDLHILEKGWTRHRHKKTKSLYQRINIVINKEESNSAMRKAVKELGITSLSGLIRYLIKKFIKE